jgi:hypothetical protein
VKEEPLICWETFKSDVGFKHMILEIDIAITERIAIKKGDDGFEQQRYDRLRKWYERMAPLKFLALVIYMLLPVVEKPCWCITDSRIAASGPGYWYCQSPD